jgi:hypothetical protein
VEDLSSALVVAVGEEEEGSRGEQIQAFEYLEYLAVVLVLVLV